jgi:hypothetical protein
MKKTIEYKGYTINFYVDLNSKIERRINGDRFHTIYYSIYNSEKFECLSELYEVIDQILVDRIIQLEETAKKYIDTNHFNESSSSIIDDRLVKLGFVED